MTVQQLIDELKLFPGYLPAKVLVTSVYGANDETGQFVDDLEIHLNPDDAIEAERVSHEGSHVLITSK